LRGFLILEFISKAERPSRTFCFTKIWFSGKTKKWHWIPKWA